MKIRRMPYSRVSSLSPIRIALGYAVIATLWIAFSDAVVTRLNLPTAVMTIKGTVFVFVTASLLYFTIRRLVQAVRLTSEALRERADLLFTCRRRVRREFGGVLKLLPKRLRELEAITPDIQPRFSADLIAPVTPATAVLRP